MISTTLKLGTFGLICGIILSSTNLMTRSTIKMNAENFKINQLREVVGNNNYEIVKQSPGQYRLICSGLLAGQLTEVTTNEGYNGEIKLWLATSALDNSVLGARIISHHETPGLGDKIELAISDWILDFNGRSLTNARWEVKARGGDFDAFSGATITPRAVIHAIQTELEKQSHQQTQSGNQPTIGSQKSLQEVSAQ